jgi:hypothetical protein
MLNTRGHRSLVVALAAAVLALPLVPPSHVHLAGIESRASAIAHQHVIVERSASQAAARGVSLTTPHGNHANAIFLTGAFIRDGHAGDPAPAMPLQPGIPPVLAPLGEVDILTVGIADRAPPRPALVRGPPSLL